MAKKQIAHDKPVQAFGRWWPPVGTRLLVPDRLGNGILAEIVPKHQFHRLMPHGVRLQTPRLIVLLESDGLGFFGGPTEIASVVRGVKTDGWKSIRIIECGLGNVSSLASGCRHKARRVWHSSSGLMVQGMDQVELLSGTVSILPAVLKTLDAYSRELGGEGVKRRGRKPKTPERKSWDARAKGLLESLNETLRSARTNEVARIGWESFVEVLDGLEPLAKEQGVEKELEKLRSEGVHAYQARQRNYVSSEESPKSTSEEPQGDIAGIPVGEIKPEQYDTGERVVQQSANASKGRDFLVTYEVALKKGGTASLEDIASPSALTVSGRMKNTVFQSPYGVSVASDDKATWWDSDMKRLWVSPKPAVVETGSETVNVMRAIDAYNAWYESNFCPQVGGSTSDGLMDEIVQDLQQKRHGAKRKRFAGVRHDLAQEMERVAEELAGMAMRLQKALVRVRALEEFQRLATTDIADDDFSGMEQPSDIPRVPCGKSMGMGESCVEGHLCASCAYLRKIGAVLSPSDEEVKGIGVNPYPRTREVGPDVRLTASMFGGCE